MELFPAVAIIGKFAGAMFTGEPLRKRIIIAFTTLLPPFLMKYLYRQ